MKKETNNITELVFILDRSGSMNGLEEDTIGGFNSLVEKQRNIEGKCFVTTVWFDGEVETLHDRIELNEIPLMTKKDYYVRGCTALIDAIGKTIDHISTIHKYAREEDIPEKTLFVIITDGLENASHHYCAESVRKTIKSKEKKGWEFLFIGANIDAVSTARTYGISEDNAVDYIADKKGSRVVYDSVCAAVGSVRSKGKMNGSWKCAINEDYENRNSKK